MDYELIDSAEAKPMNDGEKEMAPSNSKADKRKPPTGNNSKKNSRLVSRKTSL
jgi:hypothetical protein